MAHMDACAKAALLEKPTHDPIEAARRWLDTFDRVAMATVVGTWGSSPVPVGGHLVVAPDECFEGSVSGGCVEAEVIYTAGEVIKSGKPKLLDFGVTNETAWRAGLPCGGRIEVFVEPLEGSSDAAFLDELLTARRDRKAFVVRKSLHDGTREVFIDRATMPLEARECLDSAGVRVVEGPEGRFFFQSLALTTHVIIIGATHIGQVLSDLALRIGWKVTVVDPREAFSTESRFGSVARHTGWPAQALSEIGLDYRTAVVGLTHVGQIDDEGLILALRSECFYVGALGSRRTHEKRVERFKSKGVTDQEIARIHAPVGLAIGAKGPEEIAVSILAEIVKEQRRI
jgi:xanthine dehydrogenase accessory factor